MLEHTMNPSIHRVFILSMYAFSTAVSSSVLHRMTLNPFLRATSSTPRVISGKMEF